MLLLHMYVFCVCSNYFLQLIRQGINRVLINLMKSLPPHEQGSYQPNEIVKKFIGNYIFS